MTMLLLNVFGGLAIFIFGMKMMSDGLHRAAGERMRSILKFFSANRFVAIMSGTLVTAVIQSSSATTVMVIGFVNAGLLNLIQAIGIIFGANIGTTVTAQIVAFDIQWIIMPSIIVGLILIFIPRPTINGWGETIIGLGFLFLGMIYMSNELKQLADNPSFMSAFQLFKCAPVNGSIPFFTLLGAIGIGLVATLIIQSSSACTGIIIALGAGGLIDIYTAVALVLGSNIGTTITAQLAAIPANRVAKQAALAHTLFNVLGVCAISATFWITWGGSDIPLFFRAVNMLSGSGELPRHIANAHTLFNVVTTLLLIPFIPLLAKICEKIIPVRESKVKYQRLEPILLDTPAIALAQTSASLRKMLKKAWKMTDCALRIYNKNDELNQAKVKKLAEREERVDEYQRDITNYLSQLMQRQLSPALAEQIPLLIHCANDAERIGDHTAIIRDLIVGYTSAKGKLSEVAEEEFAKLHEILTRQAECSLSLLEQHSPEKQKTADRLKEEIISLTAQFEANHMKRLGSQECVPTIGVFYIELLSEIRKVSRHLANITDRAGAFYGQLQPKVKKHDSEKVLV